MSSWGTAALLVVFIASAGATWIAGLFLSKATDVLDDRFELGDAVGGMLLLGIAGSLPELVAPADEHPLYLFRATTSSVRASRA